MIRHEVPEGCAEVMGRLRDIEERFIGNAPTHRRIVAAEKTQKRFSEIAKSFDEGNRNMSEEDIAFFNRINYSRLLLERDVDAALYIKRCALKEMTRAVINSLEQRQILVMFTMFRPIIEQAAYVSWFLDDFVKIDTSKVVDPPFKQNFNSTSGEDLAWHQLQKAFAKKLFPKNADIRKLLNNDLAPNSDLPWRKKDGILDHKAEGTTKAVDRLGKKIAGVTRLYKLASEFAHPNSAIGTIFQGEPLRELSAPFVGYDEGIYSMNASGSLLWPKIRESLDVVIKVLELFFENERQLKLLSRKAQKQSLRYLRADVRYFRKIGVDFVSRKDPCPCLSGKVFGACCGGRL